MDRRPYEDFTPEIYYTPHEGRRLTKGRTQKSDKQQKQPPEKQIKMLPTSSQVTKSPATKVVLFARGSFNPPTNSHLRMFEVAKDYFEISVGWVVIEGIMEPESDKPENLDLIPLHHRLKMLECATRSSSWIKAGDWEKYIKTNLFKLQKQDNLKIILVSEYGFLESMAKQWSASHINDLLGQCDVAVICHKGTNSAKIIADHAILNELQAKIHIINDWVFYDVSPATIRSVLNCGLSVKYLIPDKVLEYIEANRLYMKNVQVSIRNMKSIGESKMQHSSYVDDKRGYQLLTNPSRLSQGKKNERSDDSTKATDMIAAMRHKYEYLEHRIGEKGQAIALWDDGSEFRYEFVGDASFQIQPSYAKKSTTTLLTPTVASKTKTESNGKSNTKVLPKLIPTSNDNSSPKMAGILVKRSGQFKKPIDKSRVLQDSPEYQTSYSMPDKDKLSKVNKSSKGSK